MTMTCFETSTCRQKIAAALSIVLFSQLACTGDDGSGSDSVGDMGDETSQSGTTGLTSTSNTSGDETATSVGTSASGSGDGSTTSDETGGETSGGVGTCGTTTCAPGEVCVNPCCGGAGPLCYEPTPRGCNGGDILVSADQCPLDGCQQPDCCQPQGGCEAPPPYCVDAGELTCEGTQCNVDDCFGLLEGEQLACTCA